MDKNIFKLILIGFLCFFLFSISLQLTPQFSLTGDDSSYLDAAKLWYFHYEVDSMRPLIISVIYGLPFLFNLNEEIVIRWGLLLNIICWLSSIIVFYKIIIEFFTPKKAFYSTLLFILGIGNLAHVFNFIPETIYVFIMIVTLYLFLKYNLTKQSKYLFIALSFLSITILIKPIALGITILVTIIYFRNLSRNIFSKYSLLLTIPITLLFFQLYQSKKLYGNYTISYVGDITYYNYLGAKAYCYQKNIEYLPNIQLREIDLKKLQVTEIKRVAKNDLKYQIKNNTLNLIRAYFFDLYSNSSKGNYIVSECKNYNNNSLFPYIRLFFKAISKIQTILFTLIGVFLSIFFLLNRKHWKMYGLMSIYSLYIFLISGIANFACDRHHLLIFPISLVFITTYLIPKFNLYLQKIQTKKNEF